MDGLKKGMKTVFDIKFSKEGNRASFYVTKGGYLHFDYFEEEKKAAYLELSVYDQFLGSRLVLLFLEKLMMLVSGGMVSPGFILCDGGNCVKGQRILKKLASKYQVSLGEFKYWHGKTGTLTIKTI